MAELKLALCLVSLVRRNKSNTSRRVEIEPATVAFTVSTIPRLHNGLPSQIDMTIKVIDLSVQVNNYIFYPTAAKPKRTIMFLARMCYV